VGGGVVVDGKVLEGAHGIAGEWGHNPLPGMTDAERSEVSTCYCGRRGCIEQWLSGPALAEHFRRRQTGIRPHGNALEIAASTLPEAQAAISGWMDRLSRALASVVNILDPDVIVLGGGLSNIDRLYRELPALVEHHAFMPESPPRILRNKYGDSSGVRGAAWLWDI
jgi:fructokinase